MLEKRLIAASLPFPRGTAKRLKERRFETAVFSSAISNRRSLKFT
jgi:hypothetical protein